MARGMDTSGDPRRDVSKAVELGIVGPNRSKTLGQAIARETREQNYDFGVVLSPTDTGERRGADRIVGGVVKWNQGRAPVGGILEGAPADVIRLTQMQENRRRAMPALMEQPPNREPVGSKKVKLVDKGLGRLLSSRTFPVSTWMDERIKAEPDPSKVAAAEAFRKDRDKGNPKGR